MSNSNPDSCKNSYPEVSGGGGSTDITLFMPSFRGGGAERVMVIIANALALRGYSVDLVVSHAVGPNLELVEDNVNIVDFKSPKVFFCFAKLKKYFKQVKPKYVLATMMHSNAICALALKLSGHTARLVLREATVPTPGGSLNNRAVYFCATYLYRLADAVVAVSEGTRDGIIPTLKLPSSLPIFVINNPLTPDLDKLSKEQTYIPGNPGDKLIVAAGRLNKTKDFKTLISAAQIVSKKENIRLVILGEGPERPALESLTHELGLKDRVFLPGFISNPFPWMVECDVFVLSSRLEGSPNILIQAVACGAKVVSSRLTGCTDVLLEPQGIGELVEFGDIHGFAESILKVMHSASSVDVTAWRNRFSVSSVVDNYESVLIGDISRLNNDR